MSAGFAHQLAERAARGDVAAAHQLGLVLASQRRYADARNALTQASDAGHADSLAWLGLFLLYGYEAAPDPVGALRLLEEAEERGSAEAGFRLATLGFAGGLVPYEPERMLARLGAAARADHLPALRACGLLHAGDGRDAEADTCLLRAAALGDRVACVALAVRRRLQGRDEEAANFDAAAARAGSARAALRAAARTPQRPPMPASDSLALPSRFPASGPRVAETWSSSPRVETVDDFFTAMECEYLIALAEPFLARSVIVSERDGSFQPHPQRTSQDAVLHGPREDFGALWLSSRMLHWLDVPLVQGEPLVVLRYRPGEEYRPHHDYLPATARGVSEANGPGQRVHTVFVYLDAVESGGETEFPSLGVVLPPRRGRIVHFVNLDAQQQPDPRTLHAGRPVVRGEKWLATLWTRQRPYRAH